MGASLLMGVGERQIFSRGDPPSPPLRETLPPVWPVPLGVPHPHQGAISEKCPLSPKPHGEPLDNPDSNQ